jgi:glycogen(starch) synthase
MESAFTVCGEELLGTWCPDVIHAHDWMVSHAGAALRRASGAPLVATIHATEAGRNNGWVSNELSTRIHVVEAWLAQTADAVITCSAAMRREVEQLFGVAGAHVIANGIDLTHWTTPNGAAARMRARNADAHPLLVYTGRVEWEKGVQTILAALPALRDDHPRLRLVVAGRGSYLPSLQAQANDLGLGDAAHFLGWVSEGDLRGLVAAADLAIAPSLYEPFGLVALEAAALGTPVVVSDTGGLAEFAADGERALTFRPGDPDSLVQAVRASLADPDGTRARAARATEALAVHYDWRVISEATTVVYLGARESLGREPGDPAWQRAQQRHHLDQPHLAAPPGHVLDTGR